MLGRVNVAVKLHCSNASSRLCGLPELDSAANGCEFTKSDRFELYAAAAQFESYVSEVFTFV